MSKPEKGKTQEQNRRDRIHRLWELIKEGYRGILEEHIEKFPNSSFEDAWKYLHETYNYGLIKRKTFAELEFETGVRRSRTEEYFKVLVQSKRAMNYRRDGILPCKDYAQAIWEELRALGAKP